MKKKWTLLSTGIILITLMGFAPGCDKSVNGDPGFLEGVITIGPLCPVETDPPDPECLPTADTYKAYPVDVWTANGKIKVAHLSPSLDGSYSIKLDPGDYIVRLEIEQVAVGSSNLPVVVSITTGEKTNLDIDIDTGIR